MSRRAVCACEVLCAWLHPPARCEAHATRVDACIHRDLRLPDKLKDRQRLFQDTACHGDDSNACSAFSCSVTDDNMRERDALRLRVKAWELGGRDEQVPAHLSLTCFTLENR